MATIPPNSMLAAQRCRQLHQRQHLLRAVSAPVSADVSPICSPENTPPPSPRKFDTLIGMNPLSKLQTMLNRSLPSVVENGGHPSLPGPQGAAPVIVHTVGVGKGKPFGAASEVTQVGVSASGQTQSLEASHHTSSITSMT